MSGQDMVVISVGFFSLAAVVITWLCYRKYD